MTPREIRGETVVFGPPPNWDAVAAGDCGSLSVRRIAMLHESAWYPSMEELARLNAGEPVILTVWGGQPPVSLNVNAGERQ